MKELDWIPQLAVENETIDSQHQRLFELYNRIFNLDAESVDKDTLLQELTDYALFHFHEEENLMYSVNYPVELIQRHKGLHSGFIARISGLKDRPVYQLLDFFREWLLLHIMNEDKKVGNFMKQQGTTPKP